MSYVIAISYTNQKHSPQQKSGNAHLCQFTKVLPESYTTKFSYLSCENGIRPYFYEKQDNEFIILSLTLILSYDKHHKNKVQCLCSGHKKTF